MTTHELALQLLKTKNIPVGIKGEKLNGVPDYIDITSVAQYKVHSLKDDEIEHIYEVTEFAVLEL
jgi:hypothetical protein